MEEKILYENEHIKITIMPEDFEAQEIYVFHSDNTYLLQRGVLKEIHREKSDSLVQKLHNLNPNILPDILSSAEEPNLKDFVIKPLRSAYEALIKEEEKSIRTIREDL